MKTNRRSATFSSLALSSLVAVTVAISSVPAFAADEYQDGCYPLLSKACLVKQEVEVTPEPKPSAKPLEKAVVPSETTLKDLVKGLQSDDTTKPIQLSESAKIGGKSNAIDAEAKIDTKKVAATIQAEPGQSLSIVAGGFTAGKFGGYVQVFVSVSGKAGNINLGRFTADVDGTITLPPITLKANSRATFVMREILRFKVYESTLKGNPPTTFKYKNTLKLADFGSDGTDDILIARSIVTADSTN